jgi:hypothetical protein
VFDAEEYASANPVNTTSGNSIATDTTLLVTDLNGLNPRMKMNNYNHQLYNILTNPAKKPYIQIGPTVDLYRTANNVNCPILFEKYKGIVSTGINFFFNGFMRNVYLEDSNGCIKWLELKTTTTNIETQIRISTRSINTAVNNENF